MDISNNSTCGKGKYSAKIKKVKPFNKVKHRMVSIYYIL